MPARPVYPANEAEIPAPSAGLVSGQILSHATLGACTVEGLYPGQASGDPITVSHSKGPTIAVPAASATTFAANAAVQFDDTTKLGVASGDFALGKALKAKIAGELEVLVVLGT